MTARRGQILTALGAIVAIAPLLAASPLRAQSYCAQFSDGTSPDCGFATLQMCMASVTGLGGVCLNNPNPQAAAQTPPPLPLPPGQTQYQLFPSQPLPQQQAAAPAPAAPACNPVIDGTYCATNGGMTVAAGGMPRIQSISSDLGNIGGNNAATLGGINISGGSTCIGLFRRMSCGG